MGREHWPHEALRINFVFRLDPESWSESGVGTIFTSSPTARIDGFFSASTLGSDWFGFIRIDDPSVSCVLEGKQLVATGRGGIRESRTERTELVSIRNTPRAGREVHPPGFEFPEMEFVRWSGTRQDLFIGLQLRMKVTFEGAAALTFGHAPPELDPNGIRIRIPEWDIEGFSFSARQLEEALRVNL